MTIDRRALAGALATLLLVAACGGSSSPAPSAAPGATRDAGRVGATPAARRRSRPIRPSRPEGPEPSLVPGAAGDLEAMLPDEVNGVKFTKTSFDGNSFPVGVPIGDCRPREAPHGQRQEPQRRAGGARHAGRRVGRATAGNMVMAIQVKGADSGKLEAWATGQLGDGSATKTTVGGKEVYGSAAPGLAAPTSTSRTTSSTTSSPSGRTTSPRRSSSSSPDARRAARRPDRRSSTGPAARRACPRPACATVTP